MPQCLTHSQKSNVVHARTATLLMAVFLLGGFAPARFAMATPLQINWITQYGNESVQTTNVSTDPRMIANISNSLMTAAPSYLNGSLYLQRRSEFTTNFQSLNGIAEVSQDWLRPDRVSISGPAVVVAAVPESFYPGAASLLTGLGWTSLGDTITLGYVDGVTQLSLFAGLVDSGPVQISGSGVNGLRDNSNITITSDYFFFENASAISPSTLAQLQSVSVPEPSSFALASFGFASLAAWTWRRRNPTLTPSPALPARTLRSSARGF